MNDHLVSTEWLAAHLRDRNVRVLDGSWHMPQAKRDPRAEFVAAHIPGAAFFDIDAIADKTSSLPHMLPTPAAFADAAGRRGVARNSRRAGLASPDSTGRPSAFHFGKPPSRTATASCPNARKVHHTRAADIRPGFEAS